MSLTLTKIETAAPADKRIPVGHFSRVTHSEIPHPAGAETAGPRRCSPHTEILDQQDTKVTMKKFASVFSNTTANSNGVVQSLSLRRAAFKWYRSSFRAIASFSNHSSHSSLYRNSLASKWRLHDTLAEIESALLLIAPLYEERASERPTGVCGLVTDRSGVTPLP